MQPMPTIQRDGRTLRLAVSQRLAKPPAELVAPFGNARNLNTTSPNPLSFEAFTHRPIEMKPGKLTHTKLKPRGLPIKWTTRITAWDTPTIFRDEQLNSPYRRWAHPRTFVEDDGQPRCDDVGEYASHGGPLAPLISRLAVQKGVEQISAYRAKKLAEKFGDESAQVFRAPGVSE
ncbi:MAG: SRPBCC family protein [Phycisphaeraceae bacterium]